jgi:hypothetical protein
MTLQLAFNTTDSPVLVDSAGHTIGGHEWGVIDSTDELGSKASGLIPADEDALAGTSNPSAKAALEQLQERRDREEAARKLDKDQLVEAVPDEVLERLPEGGDGKPAKDDLVDALVDSGEDIPQASKSTAKKTSSRSAAKK